MKLRMNVSMITGQNTMYKVEFGYYNYPLKQRMFKTYDAAKKYFYAIQRNPAVKRVELITAKV